MGVDRLQCNGYVFLIRLNEVCAVLYLFPGSPLYIDRLFIGSQKKPYCSLLIQLQVDLIALLLPGIVQSQKAAYAIIAL